jgi:hypothetical protein
MHPHTKKHEPAGKTIILQTITEKVALSIGYTTLFQLQRLFIFRWLKMIKMKWKEQRGQTRHISRNCKARRKPL